MTHLGWRPTELSLWPEYCKTGEERGGEERKGEGKGKGEEGRRGARDERKRGGGERVKV